MNLINSIYIYEIDIGYRQAAEGRKATSPKMPSAPLNNHPRHCAHPIVLPAPYLSALPPLHLKLVSPQTLLNSLWTMSCSHESCRLFFCFMDFFNQSTRTNTVFFVKIDFIFVFNNIFREDFFNSLYRIIRFNGNCQKYHSLPAV